MQHIWIHANSKFTHIASSFIRIKYLIDPLCIVGGRFYDLTIFKSQADIFKGKSLIHRRCIVAYRSVDGITYRRGKYFSVRNVHAACTGDRRNILDGKGQICSRSCQMHFISPVHQIHQRTHGFLHTAVIQIAYMEIKVFKRFCTGTGKLRHGIVRIT